MEFEESKRQSGSSVALKEAATTYFVATNGNDSNPGTGNSLAFNSC
jgi:hypothetical protein